MAIYERETRVLLLLGIFASGCGYLGKGPGDGEEPLPSNRDRCGLVPGSAVATGTQLALLVPQRSPTLVHHAWVENGHVSMPHLSVSPQDVEPSATSGTLVVDGYAPIAVRWHHQEGLDGTRVTLCDPEELRLEPGWLVTGRVEGRCPQSGETNRVRVIGCGSTAIAAGSGAFELTLARGASSCALTARCEAVSAVPGGLRLDAMEEGPAVAIQPRDSLADVELVLPVPVDLVGAMGVILANGDGGPEITRVLEPSVGGLKVGDVLIMVRGQSVADQTAATAAQLARGKPGEKLSIEISRAGERMQLDVELVSVAVALPTVPE